jgi:arabinose-5-phosphate isomerase
MLALGDALAITVQAQQNFTKEQFAQFHPGGSLGRALLTVGEIMRTGENQCLVPSGTLCAEVLHAISSTPGRPGAAGIIDSSGKLIGIFTDGDLRRCLDKEPTFLTQPIEDYMGTSPKTIQSDELIQSAEKIMTESSIDQLIVIDPKGKPVGLLDIQDIAAVR